MAGHFHLFHVKDIGYNIFRGLGYVAIVLLKSLLAGLRAFWKETRTISQSWLDLNDDLDSNFEETIAKVIRAMAILVALVGCVSLSYFVVWITQLIVNLF